MKNNKEKSRLMRFLSNPVFSSISVILTVVSLILVVYFYLEGKSKREFKYYCHPVKATVVKSGQTSALEIICNNEKIEGDITATQVAIWNSGKKPIKKEEILEPIILYTEPKTSIIDASIRKQTREVINLSIDNNYFKEGHIPLSWRILEKNDGGIIQVIFAGSTDVEILARGTIEEQGTIKKVKSLLRPGSPTESYRMKYKYLELVGMFSFLFASFLFLFLLKYKGIKLIEGDEKIIRLIHFIVLRIIPITSILFFVTISILCLFIAGKEIQPPFSF
jgi:hypothetical protein